MRISSTADLDEVASFKKYLKEVKYNQRLMEDLIDRYYHYVTKEMAGDASGEQKWLERAKTLDISC